MKDLLNILTKNNLKNLEGFECRGQLLFPKKVFISSLTKPSIEESTKNDSSSSYIIEPLVNYLELKEAKVSFENDKVRVDVDLGI